MLKCKDFYVNNCIKMKSWKICLKARYRYDFDYAEILIIVIVF